MFAVFFQDFIAHTQGDLPGQGAYAVAFQSIDSLLSNLFVFHQYNNPFPFINLPILKPIIKYTVLGLIFGTLYIAFKKNHYKITPVLVSIAIIGAFVILPASASYHFLLLLCPVLYIIQWLFSYKSTKALGIVSILLFITFTIQQHHIPNFNQFPTVNLLLHYPRFWSLLCVFLIIQYYYIKAPYKNYG